jgi:surface protein
MSVKFGSGKGKFVGQSIIYPFPVPLEAAQHVGAVIVVEDGQLYFSDGADWVIPTEDVDISRPAPLVPTDAAEQTQLRLTNFSSPKGFTQEGILFEVSFTNNFEAPDFTRTVNSTITNLYQTIYPEDGIEPGDTFWWRARYLGSQGTQSAFSLPFRQTYPELISDPIASTREGAVTGFLEITPFESAFGLNYVATQVEIYELDGQTLFDSFISIVGASTPVPGTVPEGASYIWRARYGGRVGLSGPILYTEWTEKRSFLNGARSMVLVFDPALAVDRTVYLPLRGTVNVTVDWGDGSSDTYTSSGNRTHIYDEGFTGLATVTVSGTLSQYGWGTAIFAGGNAGLVRVDNIGFGLGLTSLSGAFQSTGSGFVFLNPNLPPQITDLSHLFQYSVVIGPDITNLDVSNVQDFTRMFHRVQDMRPEDAGWGITDWDVSSAKTFESMFASGRTDDKGFNQNIGGWNVSNVTSFKNMFSCIGVSVTQDFNQNIGGWDTSSVTDMSGMFGITGTAGAPSGYHSFNNGGSDSIRNWDTSNVTTMRGMFGQNLTSDLAAGGLSNHAFNQPIGDWNVNSVENFFAMFGLARSFNQSLANWTTPAAADMRHMFQGAAAFNNAVGSFTLTGNLTGMFNSASVFNHPSIVNWNVSSVTNMSFMFQNAGAFNQDITGWNVSNATDMRYMFAVPSINTTMEFNRDISVWDVSSVTTMQGMFGGQGFSNFDQPIGNWDVSNVTDMREFFGRTFNRPVAFNQDISGWQLNPGFIQLNNFFGPVGVYAFSEDNYSRLLTGWANNATANNGPFNVTANFKDFAYNDTEHFVGALYESAVEARAYLTNPNRLTVSSAGDANADGDYAFDGTVQLYMKANDWYFIKIGGVWELRDNLDAVQATQQDAGNLAAPQLVDSWNGDLATATVLRTGAAWTITDGGLAA